MTDIINKAFHMLADDSDLLRRVTTEWHMVVGKIEERAAKMRPKMKVYEVWHEIQIAREALLGAIVEGKSPENAKFIALDRVGIGYVRNAAGRFLRWTE